MTVEAGILMPGGKAGVLLLHDLGAPAAELRPLAHHFNEAGFTVALPQIAAGANAGPARLTGSALINEAEDALARLKARCADVLIAGISYGGMLGLELARQNASAVQAVVLVEPRAWLPGVAFPFRERLSVHVRQAWIADVTMRLKALLPERAQMAQGPVMGLAASTLAAPTARCTAFGTGQILDCLHATLPGIRQPVLVARRQEAPQAVLNTSILLQRRLGGRVETAIIDAGGTGAEGDAMRFQADLAERGARFLGAVMNEVTTRRDNEQRRRRASGGQSNAA